MSYKVIERETQALLANGALKRLSTDELLEHQTQLRGRVVVITGGASGLGRAFSVGAARRGAKVVIGDVDVKGLEETLSLIAAARGEACGQRCDVTNWDDQLALFDLAQSRYGRVDIVVPNAGIADTNPAEFAASSEENGLQKPNLKTLDVDVAGVIYTARIGLHHMRQNPAKEGKALILIASYAAFYGSPITLLYATAKHAVLGLGRSLRYVTANDGINCITLCPYFIDTPLTSTLKPLISRNALAKVDDFVSALTYASTAPPAQLSSGTLVFVHPSGVMVGAGGRGTRPGPFEMPKL